MNIKNDKKSKYEGVSIFHCIIFQRKLNYNIIKTYYKKVGFNNKLILVQIRDIYKSETQISLLVFKNINLFIKKVIKLFSFSYFYYFVFINTDFGRF